jgi:hypothetical protein
MNLKDKTIVVTGGSRGLGLVEALVEQGAKVTVVARDPAALAAVKQRLGVAVISADVTDEGPPSASSRTFAPRSWWAPSTGYRPPSTCRSSPEAGSSWAPAAQPRTDRHSLAATLRCGSTGKLSCRHG